MVDRSSIRVKAMVYLPNTAGTHHAVLRGEDPTGDRVFHRLIGGSVELGERATEAIVREVAEELRATLVEPELLGVVENVFTYDGSSATRSSSCTPGGWPRATSYLRTVAATTTSASRCGSSGARSATPSKAVPTSCLSIRTGSGRCCRSGRVERAQRRAPLPTDSPRMRGPAAVSKPVVLIAE